MTESAYKGLYERHLQAAARGLSSVPGGTGLGKTSGIVEFIKGDDAPRKYVYCTNRVQLLDDMERQLNDAKIGVAHLRSNQTLLLRVLQDDALAHAHRELLHSPEVKTLRKVAADAGWVVMEPAAVERACRDILYLEAIEERAGTDLRDVIYDAGAPRVDVMGKRPASGESCA